MVEERNCISTEKLFVLFVLHEEFFRLKDVIVEVHFVDLNVPNITTTTVLFSEIV